MIKHWIRNLPEVGDSFLREAERIEARWAAIKKAEDALRAMRRDLLKAEKDATREILCLWTEAEVNAARRYSMAEMGQIQAIQQGG